MDAVSEVEMCARVWEVDVGDVVGPVYELEGRVLNGKVQCMTGYRKNGREWSRQRPVIVGMEPGLETQRRLGFRMNQASVAEVEVWDNNYYPARLHKVAIVLDSLRVPGARMSGEGFECNMIEGWKRVE